MKFLIVQDGRHVPYRVSYLGHNFAAGCLILVKFCVGKQFFLHNFVTETDAHISQKVFFVFLIEFGFQQVAALVSSPIDLLFTHYGRPAEMSWLLFW